MANLKAISKYGMTLFSIVFMVVFLIGAGLMICIQAITSIIKCSAEYGIGYATRRHPKKMIQ